jgi:hypothetical protein
MTSDPVCTLSNSVYSYPPVAGHGGVLSGSGRRERSRERKAEDERIRNRAREDTEDGALRETEGTAEQGVYRCISRKPLFGLHDLIFISYHIVPSLLTMIFVFFLRSSWVTVIKSSRLKALPL